MKMYSDHLSPPEENPYLFNTCKKKFYNKSDTTAPAN